MSVLGIMSALKAFRLADHLGEDIEADKTAGGRRGGGFRFIGVGIYWALTRTDILKTIGLE